MICDRCQTHTNTTTVSYMNTDTLCMTCRTEEQSHPMYAAAKEAELAACKTGNFNYPGLFAGGIYPFKHS